MRRRKSQRGVNEEEKESKKSQRGGKRSERGVNEAVQMSRGGLEAVKTSKYMILKGIALSSLFS